LVDMLEVATIKALKQLLRSIIELNSNP